MSLDEVLSKSLVCVVCCETKTKNEICKNCSELYNSLPKVRIEDKVKLYLEHFFEGIQTNYNKYIGGVYCKTHIDGSGQLLLSFNPHDTAQVKVPLTERVKVLVQHIRNQFKCPVTDDKVSVYVSYLFYGTDTVHQKYAELAEMTLHVLPNINDASKVQLDDDVAKFDFMDLDQKEMDATTPVILNQTQAKRSSPTTKRPRCSEPFKKLKFIRVTLDEKQSATEVLEYANSRHSYSSPVLSVAADALLLLAGYGTRLRPLTFSIPKPLVEFANKPMIFHQIAALAAVGVTEVVLAVNYQPEVMLRAMKEVEEKYNIKITFSIEEEPLGTAGPLALARQVLGKDESPFFVLNSDVICDFPFEKMLAFHKAHKKEGTILATRVKDPSKYGVIVRNGDTSEILKFVEKPKDWVGDQINAGIYIFNPAILKRIEPKPMSIEKEIFPFMAAQSELHVIDLEGFWADVGQPKDFIVGTTLYLNSISNKNPAELTKSIDDSTITGNVLIDSSAKVGKKCKIGPNVVIGPNCTIGDGVRLSNCVLMPHVTAKDNSFVKDSIVGWHSSVGKWSRLCNTCVLGEDVHVHDEVFINGGSVLPHKSVSSDILEPKIVM